MIYNSPDQVGLTPGHWIMQSDDSGPSDCIKKCTEILFSVGLNTNHPIEALEHPKLLDHALEDRIAVGSYFDHRIVPRARAAIGSSSRS